MPSITTSDNVRLDYTESGDATGRPIVLIAGFKAAASSWKFQQKPLQRSGYRVIAFDRRGHGTSEVTTEGPTMQRHGADLQELLEQLDLHDAVLVGGSQGGNTIWSTIAQFGSDRIAGAVIVDQTPSMLNLPDWPHGFYGYDESNAHTYFAETIPATGVYPLKSKGLLRIARLLRAMAGAKGGALTPTELALLGDHARADWRPTIATMDKPVLFVAGAESEFWPSEHAEASAALTEKGLWRVIEHAGHPTNIEQPGEFNQVLVDFLRSV